MPNGNDVDRETLKCICGILFFGVPNQGMAVTKLVPMVNNQPNRMLIESLRQESEVLLDLSRSFRQCFHFPDSEVYSFYETKLSPTACEVSHGVWKMCGTPELLVSEHSATHGRQWEDGQSSDRFVYPIEHTHSEMVKFRNSSDENYRVVSSILMEMATKGAKIIESRFLRPTAAQLLNDLSDVERGMLPNIKPIAEYVLRSHTECLRSFSISRQGVQVESRFDMIQEAKGTCDWILKHPEYIHWTNSANRLLWLRGKPGSGKSTLMKFLHSRLSRESIGAMAAFWVYGQGLSMQRSKVGLLRSLLQQLLKTCPQSLKQITSEFEEKRAIQGGSWDWQAGELKRFLVQTLKEACTTQQRVIILVDALDELGEAVGVETVDLFEDLIRTIPGNLKIIFSCRQFPILTLDEGKYISLEHCNQLDIETVVKERLERITGSDTLVHEIVGKSDGVFLWAILVVDDISKKARQGRSLESLKKHIRSLSEELHELYADALDQPSSETLRLFEWVRFASRPLSLEELSHAIAVDAELRFQSIDDYERKFEFGRTRSQLERMITTLSRGLMEVRQRRISVIMGREFIDKNNTVHFIHQSVADFRDRQDLVNGNVRRLTLDPAKANIQLCRTCFAYMRLQDVQVFLKNPKGYVAHPPNPSQKVARHSPYKDLYYKLPLLKYAANTWSFHLKAAHDANVQPADILGCFFFENQDEHSGNDGSFALSNDYVSILETCSDILSSLQDENRLQGTIMHVSAHLGLTRVLDFLIKVAGIDVDIARTQDGRTGTHIAAERGFADTLDVLLKAGAKVDLRDRQGNTPLILAIQAGLEDAVGTLVDAGADLKSDEDINQLLAVSNAGYQRIGVVRKLFSHGANVNSRDSSHQTLLNLAVTHGNAELARALLDCGADINLRDSSRRTPIFHAVANGNAELVKILLFYGPQVDISDNKGRTPLHQSLQLRRIDSEVITDLLLAAKANVDVRDHEGFTPLSMAIRKCQPRVSEKLLAVGADIDIKDNEGKTPIFHAAERDVETLRLLINAKADVNLRDSQGRTPIFYAIQHAALETIRGYGPTHPRCNKETCPFLMLLVRTTDLTVRDNQGSTMFSPVAAVIKRGAIGIRKRGARRVRYDVFDTVNFEDPPLEPLIPLEKWNKMKEMILNTSEIREATHGLTENLKFEGLAAEVNSLTGMVTELLHVPICGLIFRFNIH